VAEKVTLRLSTAAAVYARGDAPKQEKLKAARGEVPFGANDLGTLLLLLSFDADPEVKGAAVHTLREMPHELLTAIAGSRETHPKVLDLLARLHFGKGDFVEKLLDHPAVEPRTVEFLASKGCAVPAENPVATFPEALNQEVEADVEEACAPEEDGGYEEEEEEYKSKYKLCQELGVADKIKIALSGDKEWRSILLKDSNKLVSGAAIKNPRITEPEVLAIAKSKIQNDEILRVICMNKEWLKNYQIRKALVENSKTPLPSALRFMSTLTEKDLAALAKSKNVGTVISTQARRILTAKKKD
jgi:hypothetical protein